MCMKIQEKKVRPSAWGRAKGFCESTVDPNQIDDMKKDFANVVELFQVSLTNI